MGEVRIHEDLNIEGYLLKNFINLNEDESEMIRRWRNHPDIKRWMYTDHEISKEEHRRFIDSLRKTKDKAYWLVVDHNNKYIGVLYLINIRWNHRHAYYGIYSNPEDRVPGAGRVLDSLALKVAFDVLNLHTLKLEVIETNRAVLNLHRKFGFQEEGRLKEFVYKDGKWLDVIVMGIINPREVGDENS